VFLQFSTHNRRKRSQDHHEDDRPARTSRRNLPDSALAAWLLAKPIDQIGHGEQAIGGERAAAIRDHR
jgi:hypothetical protein